MVTYSDVTCQPPTPPLPTPTHPTPSPHTPLLAPLPRAQKFIISSSYPQLGEQITELNCARTTDPQCWAWLVSISTNTSPTSMLLIYGIVCDLKIC